MSLVFLNPSRVIASHIEKSSTNGRPRPPITTPYQSRLSLPRITLLHKQSQVPPMTFLAHLCTLTAHLNITNLVNFLQTNKPFVSLLAPPWQGSFPSDLSLSYFEVKQTPYLSETSCAHESRPNLGSPFLDANAI